MRLFHRLAPLSLCVVFLLGIMDPAFAGEQPPQGRVYRALDDSPYQIRFNRDVDFGRITRSIGEDTFYWGDGDLDFDTFTLLWDEAEFDAAVERGETEFAMTGQYGLSPGSSPELTELWNAGLVTMPAPPRLLVHIRPRDYVTVYAIQDQALVWTVSSGTSFEEATRYQETVTLRPEEGANPYGDRIYEDFSVTWSREEYESGMESGAETFPVSGSYGEPDWDAMKGWARAEGTARATVVVEREADQQPLVYRNPMADELGGTACTAYVTPDTQMEELALPEEETLRLVGGTYQDTRRFSYQWSREAFEAGMASGKEVFTVPGYYAPHPLWTAEEQQRWIDRRILVDMPAPEATVRVLRDGKYPFAADVRINHYGDLGPCFIFPWVAGTKEVVLAYSLDNETWRQEVWTWDDLPSDQRLTGQAELTLIAGDASGNPLITQNTTVVYVKMTVAGSSLAGTSEVYDLKPAADGWDMTPHDDNSGDHGGGGQGESTRPGKDEVPVLPSRAPEPLAPTPHPTPASAPVSEPDSTPSSNPMSSPSLSSEELSVVEIHPVQEASASPPPSGGKKAPTGSGALRSAPPQDPPREASPSSVQTSAAEASPTAVPEHHLPAPTPVSVPQAGPSAIPSTQAPSSHVPGFAAAGAATAAAVLGAAVWFRRHRKRR